MKNSNWMEKEGLVRGVQNFKDHGLAIEELITDRHKQNNKWIKENLPETKHYFDIWHVSKGKNIVLLLITNFTMVIIFEY